MAFGLVHTQVPGKWLRIKYSKDLRRKTHNLLCFPSGPFRGKHIFFFLPPYLPTTCGQAHSVQMSQTNLFRGVKTCGFLSPINNSLQHFRNCLSWSGEVIIWFSLPYPNKAGVIFWLYLWFGDIWPTKA